MIGPQEISRSIKIGRNWLFDTSSLIGYRVIRRDGDVVGFEKQFTLVKVGNNDYECVTDNKIPIGVSRKSIQIAKGADRGCQLKTS